MIDDHGGCGEVPRSQSNGRYSLCPKLRSKLALVPNPGTPRFPVGSTVFEGYLVENQVVVGGHSCRYICGIAKEGVQV